MILYDLRHLWDCRLAGSWGSPVTGYCTHARRLERSERSGQKTELQGGAVVKLSKALWRRMDRSGAYGLVNAWPEVFVMFTIGSKENHVYVKTAKIFRHISPLNLLLRGLVSKLKQSQRCSGNHESIASISWPQEASFTHFLTFCHKMSYRGNTSRQPTFTKL